MPFQGEVSASYLVPRDVLAVLQQPRSSFTSGMCPDSGYCWVLEPHSLYVWRYKDSRDARLITLRLAHPHGPGSSAAVLTQRGSGITVLAISPDGRLSVWLDGNPLALPSVIQALVHNGGANNAAGSSGSVGARQPVSVTAFACCRAEHESGPAFLAAVASSDSSWSLIQGNLAGIFVKQLAAPLPSVNNQSKGMLGALSSVLSRTYHEAFDPSARFVRGIPSGKPAISVQICPINTTHFRVFLLSEHNLDCWLVNLGVRPSENLVWSFLNVEVAAIDRRVSPAVNVAFDVQDQRAMIWVMGQQLAPQQQRSEQNCAPLQHWIQSVVIADDGLPALSLGTLDVVDSYNPVMRFGSRAGSPSQPFPASCSTAPALCHDPQSGMSLLFASDGSVAEVNGVSNAASVVCLDADTLAVGCQRGQRSPVQGLGNSSSSSRASAVPGSAWVALSATYGAVELAIGSASRPAVTVTHTSVPGPLSPEGQQAVVQLLDAVMCGAASARHGRNQLLNLVSGLPHRLAALGALSPTANMHVFVDYSVQLLDLLPKQGSAEDIHSLTSQGAGGGPSLLEQLADKDARHTLYLQCLLEGGVLQSLTPAVQRTLLENAEKAAVACSLLSYQIGVLAFQNSNMGSDTRSSSDSSSSAGLINYLVDVAGKESSVRDYEVLRPWQVFYARPSQSVGRLLDAIRRSAVETESSAGSNRGSGGDVATTTLLSYVLGLGQVLKLVQAATQGKRDLLQGLLRLRVSDLSAQLSAPDWLSGEGAREATQSCAKACMALAHLVRAPSDRHTLSHTFFDVTELLLAGFAAAVAVAPNATAKLSLMVSYRNSRYVCASALLTEALAELYPDADAVEDEQGAMEVSGSAVFGQARRTSPQSLIWSVEQLCRAHHCYEQLFDVCEALDRSELGGSQSAPGARLHAHMAGMPPEDGASSEDTFARFVFQRLHHEGRHADLLQLPDMFLSGLTRFLEAYPALQWTLQLRVGRCGEATAALLQDAGATTTHFGQHLRLVALAKLASRAAADRKHEKDCDDKFRLLEVQEQLGLQDTHVMEVGSLVDAALRQAQEQQQHQQQQQSSRPHAHKRRPLTPTLSPASSQQHQHPSHGATHLPRSPHSCPPSVLAIQALVVAAPDVRASLSQQWQAAWKYTLEADDWSKLEAKLDGGPEDALKQLVAETAVYRAALVCCGSGAFGEGEGGRDSEPLQQVKRWLGEWSREFGARVGLLVMQALQLALSSADSSRMPAASIS